MRVLISEPRQEPVDVGQDRIGRQRYVVNADILHTKETDEDLDPTVEAALAEYLRVELASDVLEAGRTLLAGKGADLQEDVDLALRVVQGAGFPGIKTHADLLAYPRTAVQLTIYGRDALEAVRLAYRAWRAVAFANKIITAA